MTNYVYWTTAGMSQALSLKVLTMNLQGWELGLFVNVPIFSPYMGMAALVEASFPGYARQSLNTFHAALANPYVPHYDAKANAYRFLCTGAGSTDVYKGWFVRGPVNALLFLGLSNLGAPLAFDQAGKFLQLTPRLTEAPYAAYP